MSLATDGERIVAGVWGSNPASNRVFVYRDSPSGFVLEAELFPPPGFESGGFGFCVSISGDRLVAGAPGMTVSSVPNAGNALVFEWVNGAWIHTHTLEARSPQIGSGYGRSFTILDDVIAIAESGSLSRAEGVSIYRASTSGWALEFEIPEHGTSTGVALELSNGHLFVGAPKRKLPGPIVLPAVLDYRTDGTTWELSQVLSIDPGHANGYGYTIDFKDGLLAVGGGHAQGWGGGGPTYVFREMTNTSFPFFRTEIVIEEPTGESAQPTDAALFGGDLWLGTSRATAFSTGGALFRAPLHRAYAKVCDGSVNSRWVRAELEAVHGCPTLMANDLILSATKMPPFQFAMLVVGSEFSQDSGIFGNPLATLCAQGSIGRGEIRTANLFGATTFTFDINAIAQPNGPVAATAGSSWVAQVVYRDPEFFYRAGVSEALLIRVE